MRIALPRILQPVDELDERAREQGLRMVLRDGVTSQIMGTLTGGPFLVAFVLALGGSTLTVGLIAALGPFSQMLQVPAIYLVEWARRRKALVVLITAASRLFWLPVALLPWLAPPAARIPLLIACVFAYFALGTVSGLAFNSWMRDLIPSDRLGSVFSRRLALGTAIGAVLSLLAGLLVDLLSQRVDRVSIYAWYLGSGGLIGLSGVNFLARIPEPRMPTKEVRSVFSILRMPLRDRNFRRLLLFLGSWSFAVNLATPFFVVYMLRRLHLGMTEILSLTVLSQAFNVGFYRLWGNLADRFGNKAVLLEAGPLLIFVTMIWPFTDRLQDQPMILLPLLISIHALSGISTAGVTLCTGNLALKLAPSGHATAYLAVNALISGLAAMLAPILGGYLSSHLQQQTLSMNLQWSSAQQVMVNLPTLQFRGLDFVFLLSLLVGLYAMHRLLAVKELGKSESPELVTEARLEVRKVVRSVTSVAGLRDLFYFPYAWLMVLIERDPWPLVPDDQTPEARSR